jgi:hypothetical protein
MVLLIVRLRHSTMTSKGPASSGAPASGGGGGGAGGGSAAASDNVALDKLYELKIQKIKEQKELSDAMNETLTKHGGLNENSKMTRKSLQAAIAVAKQPGLFRMSHFDALTCLPVVRHFVGYFDYYRPTDEVKDIEEGKVLNQYARKIAKVHAELEQINSEIDKAKRPPQTVTEIPLSSLGQWFDVYGRPKPNPAVEDMLTTFSPSPKIYGGTAHHRSFKTQASIMRSGRITR